MNRKNASRGHRCEYIGNGDYRVSWQYQVEHTWCEGSAIVDASGARRFNEKWGTSTTGLERLAYDKK